MSVAAGPRSSSSSSSLLVLCLASGMLGAAASVLAKLASSTTPGPGNLVYATLCGLIVDPSTACLDIDESAANWDRYHTIASTLRTICIGTMVICNAQMWGLFTLALSKSESSTRVSVLNTASNLCFTAIMGRIFFAEPLRVRWWIGAACVVAGTVLMTESVLEEGDRGSERSKKSRKKKEA